MKEILPPTYDMIDTVIDGFDFNKVLKVMDLMDWKWQQSGELQRPTYEDLKLTARVLLRQAVDGDFKPGYTVGTGGFMVTILALPYTNQAYLDLSFQISHKASW